ncbi:hypothetical protein ABZ746_37925 [Streptomyces sp. NPDC020096]
MVNRMDEFALTLAGPGDLVILKKKPDPAYVEYLTALGRQAPRTLVPVESEPARDVTGDALADKGLLEQLAALRDQGAVIVAHGVSERVERLSQESGLRLAAPPVAVCKSVNSKVYSRRLAERLGLRQPGGWWCDSLERWGEAVLWARDVLRGGGRVAVKDAFGVSGKGILQIGEESRLDQLDRLFTNRRKGQGDSRLGVVVEEWVAKSVDLNYQFTLGRDGSVHLDFVKEALTRNGVHMGHLVPARLSAEVRDGIAAAAMDMGAALATDGYHGVVGVDAMLDPEGGLYPLTEINARNNMSTYQEPLLELLHSPGATALARYYPVVRRRPASFAELRALLGDALLTSPGDGCGMVVNNFATVNSGIAAGGAGRLYGILLGPDTETVSALDKQVTELLAQWREDGAHE